MRHRANPKFWQFYEHLPSEIQRLADANFELLKADSRHPSLHFKRVGRMWSVRVGIHYRAAAVEYGTDMIWFGSDTTANTIGLLLAVAVNYAV